MTAFRDKVVQLGGLYYYPCDDTAAPLVESLTGGAPLDANQQGTVDYTTPDIYPAIPGGVSGTPSGNWLTGAPIPGIATQDSTIVFAIRAGTPGSPISLMHVGNLSVSQEWGYLIQYNNNTLGVFTYDISQGGFGSVQTTTPLVQGQEYFVCFRWTTGVQVEYFLDGVLQETLPFLHNKQTPATGGPLTIGGIQQGGTQQRSDNQLAHIAEFPSLLSNQDISDLYTILNASLITGTIEFPYNVEQATAAPVEGTIEFPYDVAEALVLVNGRFKFLYNVESEQEICRAYRVLREGESFFKGFADKSAILTRGPLVNDTFNRYYLVQDGDVPRYTTYEVLELERRIRAQLVENQYYRLGVPRPQTAPSVVPSGGTEDLTVDRSYVYTWVSAFGEEGPPSDPTVVSGADDGDWLVSNFDTDVPFADERLISNLRLYRTVTSTLGTVDFQFVADLSFDDVTFVDNVPTSTVGANFTLESESFFPPPEGLQNLVEHPNGFFIGNVGRDIYMSEPFRPHAWNPDNTLSTLGDIVGFGIFGTSVVIATESYPYVMSGISPSSMTLTQNDTAEPCLSRYGIVSMPNGVVYPGPNGLILVNSRGFNTVTEGLMTREEWQSRYDPANIDAAQYQNSYVAFYSNRAGFLFTPTDPLYTFVELNEFFDNCGIQTDEYSGKTLLSNGVALFEWNPPTGANVQYTWESKEFDVPDPVNFGAFRIIWYGDPVPSEEQIQQWRDYNVIRNQNPLGPINWGPVATAKKEYVPDIDNDAPEWNQPIGGPVLYRVPPVGEPWPGTDTLTAEFFANDRLVHTKVVDNDGTFRLPSGFKATRWRIRLTGSVKVKSVKIAETGKELSSV